MADHEIEIPPTEIVEDVVVKKTDRVRWINHSGVGKKLKFEESPFKGKNNSIEIADGVPSEYFEVIADVTNVKPYEYEVKTLTSETHRVDTNPAIIVTPGN